MADDARRLTLRSTFETRADRYHTARPDYPTGLFEELARLTGVSAGDSVLEIGCATGKATIPLAERGLVVTCLEIGPELAAAARRNLVGRSGVEVVECPFEQWQPGPATRYDLIVAATSWHWVDPAVRYEHAFELLRPGKHLAVWSASHVFPEGGDPFFVELQEVYDEIGEGMPAGASRPRPGELADDLTSMESSGLFEVVGARQFDWVVDYTAEEYISLLETFSSHIVMEPWQRDRLYGEVRRRLSERPDGRVRRGWGAALSVARRRQAGPPSV